MAVLGPLVLDGGLRPVGFRPYHIIKIDFFYLIIHN